MDKLILMVVAANPLWLALPASALVPIAQPGKPYEPQLTQVYNSARGAEYYEVPAVYYRSFHDRCESLNLQVRFCRDWMQEVVDYKRQWGMRPPLEQLLERLSRIDAAMRRQLGTYNFSRDYPRQNWRLQSLGINPQDVDDRVDYRFRGLFPEHSGRISASERMTGQVWIALREEEVTRLERNARNRTQPPWN